MRTKKADRLAQTPKRKQMWVFTDKWVELHSEIETLKRRVTCLENQVRDNLKKNELYPNK
jgi:transposase